MNLLNEEITHKVFGEGNIVEHEDSVLTVDFNTDIKKFVYPDAFENFLTLNDPLTAKTFEDLFLKKQQEQEAIEKKRAEEKERLLLEQQRRDMLKDHKIHESSQIAFWLDEDRQQEIFTDWKISTGTVRSGANKGQPNKVARLRPNSAGLLTVRNANQDEKERKILGLFMVHEVFSGDLGTDGLVPTHEEFKIELTEQEADQMLFWNYYMNASYPERTTWNSGKFRYYDNIWTAQIIQDIIALKTDEKEIALAKKFLEYFCTMNALDITNIPEANGPLRLKSA
ncbi:malate synthase [Sporosarcina sp. Sa2YVA2]|uniref:Malate synthase n=1 Tax=Sporosarcina quadrami TaxID=2762234 RepID=A0ABR8UE20_9BACL|nr:malate synthase [Sporosarcina quadrami]MBD7986274.1 malate synthase [Sporosarcina quadrami]